MADMLRINEIFHSIQGESTRVGRPCVFVRLSGCHLRCAYCDTEYAFHEGRRMTLDDIVASVQKHPSRLVEITGGEPLLQPAAPALITRLCDLGYETLIETSGACDISDCDPRSVRIMDIKTPGSGESERMDWSNIARLTTRDEVKFVLCDREDYEWARSKVREHNLDERAGAVLFSPVFEQAPGLEIAGVSELPLATLAAWILEDGDPVTLQPQLHKFIWSPTMRGV